MVPKRKKYCVVLEVSKLFNILIDFTMIEQPQLFSNFRLRFSPTPKNNQLTQFQLTCLAIK